MNATAVDLRDLCPRFQAKEAEPECFTEKLSRVSVTFFGPIEVGKLKARGAPSAGSHIDPTRRQEFGCVGGKQVQSTLPAASTQATITQHCVECPAPADRVDSHEYAARDF
jgi:hypothetical protein